VLDLADEGVVPNATFLLLDVLDEARSGVEIFLTREAFEILARRMLLMWG
jgi:hypothetical protein